MTICRNSSMCRPSCKSAFEGMSLPEVEKILYATVMGLGAEELEEHGVDMSTPPEPPSYHWGLYSRAIAPYGM